MVVAVVNFPPRQIGPFMSEVLVLGALDDELGVVLLRPDRGAAARLADRLTSPCLRAGLGADRQRPAGLAVEHHVVGGVRRARGASRSSTRSAATG